MKPEIQRIKIAEACGWTFHPPPYNTEPYSDAFKSEALACWVAPGDDFWQQRQPPDYLNDLNAVYVAKCTLLTTRELCDAFNSRLISERPCGEDRKFEVQKWSWGQSAEHQCRALLQVINLWQDESK